MLGGQCLAAPLNQPLEEPVKDGLAECADGKEDLVVLVKASPAIVIDPGEKGEHSGGSRGLEPQINSRSQKNNLSH